MTCILAFRKWIRICKSWKTIWHFPFWISACWRAWAPRCPLCPGGWSRRWCRTRCTSCSSSSRPRRPARRPWCRSAAARGWSARTGESLKLGGGLCYFIASFATKAFLSGRRGREGRYNGLIFEESHYYGYQGFWQAATMAIIEDFSSQKDWCKIKETSSRNEIYC